MTLAEKILAAHSGKKEVKPGEFIDVKVDLVFANDTTAPTVIREFQRLGVPKVFNPDKVAMIADHLCPNKDIQAAENAKQMREFAKKQGGIYFGAGQGIEHVLLPEKGLTLPSQVIIGGDSHTCTYGALGAFATGMGSTDIAVAMATGEIWMKVPPTIKFIYHGVIPKWVGGKDLILNTINDIGVDGALYSVMEFAGEAVDKLPMDGRFTMANMAIEAGAKAGIFNVDDKTKEYVVAHSSKSYSLYESDADAEYSKIIQYDVSKIEPQIAFPHLPSNTKPVSQVGNIKLDQVVIGSCNNGRLGDLRIAAKLLRGRKVHPEIRCLIFPGSQQVYLGALREGLVEIFIEAGAVVSPPTCGPCCGGHMGILAAGERCLSTTNRNFIGRMGDVKSEVYLANPALAAASAILGRIGNPEEVLS